MDLIPLVAACFAVLPCLLFLRNIRLFQPPILHDLDQPEISVLIPARNEESSIERCLEAILLSEGVKLEVIVLDDQSTDRTAQIVRAIASRDPRVRLESAPPLPPGWSGKQHACYVLSQFAIYDTLTFLDADVRLQPHALQSMASFLKQSQAELVSGFPHQETGTIFEKLLIPLINWLLLCFLPLDRMKFDKRPGLGAGCGQWFMTSKSAYVTIGGHAAVKDSFHDGVKLPRAYRRAGFLTDLCDATPLATCRMYTSATQVWNGLAKNAREGLGSPGLIGFWTVILFFGQILPFLCLGLIPWLSLVGGVAVGLGLLAVYLPRMICALRFRQSVLSVLLHPVGIVLLLAIQWYANFRHFIGRPVGWKGRTLPQQTT